MMACDKIECQRCHMLDFTLTKIYVLKSEPPLPTAGFKSEAPIALSMHVP